MKQKEYLRLITNVTTLNTKLKLQHEQIIPFIKNCEERLTAAGEQLTSIQTTLRSMETGAVSHELTTAVTAQRRILHGLEKDLKSNVENPINHYLKQVTPLKVTFQKLHEQLQGLPDDCGFDLVDVRKQFAQAQEYLTTNEHLLQTATAKYTPLQETITRDLEISGRLMIERELEDTTQKAAGLSHRLAAIERTLEGSPGLKSKYSKQVTPLKEALETLTAQTGLLTLTEGTGSADEKKMGEEQHPTRACDFR